MNSQQMHMMQMHGQPHPQQMPMHPQQMHMMQQQQHHQQQMMLQQQQHQAQQQQQQQQQQQPQGRQPQEDKLVVKVKELIGGQLKEKWNETLKEASKKGLIDFIHTKNTTCIKSAIANFTFFFDIKMSISCVE